LQAGGNGLVEFLKLNEPYFGGKLNKLVAGGLVLKAGIYQATFGKCSFFLHQNSYFLGHLELKNLPN